MKQYIKISLAIIAAVALTACSPRPKGKFVSQLTKTQVVELFEPQAKNIVTGTAFYAITESLSPNEIVEVAIDFDSNTLTATSKAETLKNVASLFSIDAKQTGNKIMISSLQTGKVAHFELTNSNTLLSENNITFKNKN